MWYRIFRNKDGSSRSFPLIRLLCEKFINIMMFYDIILFIASTLFGLVYLFDIDTYKFDYLSNIPDKVVGVF